jgi:hypothetical protein
MFINSVTADGRPVRIRKSAVGVLLAHEAGCEVMAVMDGNPLNIILGEPIELVEFKLAGLQLPVPVAKPAPKKATGKTTAKKS